jgi:xylulokinase
MAEKYIVSHDLGTSGNKAVLVTVYGEIIDTDKQTYPIYHPHSAWAEQDPDDWWKAVCDTTRNVIQKAGVKPEDIVGVTFSSQSQTLVPVDENCIPVRPAISWLDGRSADIMREKVWTPPRVMGYNIFNILKFLIITGGSPGQTGKDQIGKILWLQQHEPENYNKIKMLLDAKDYVVYHMTGNYVKSADMAVLWWFLDTRKNRNVWHPKLCKLANIKSKMLPEVKESAAVVGEITKKAAEVTGLLPGTPVINGAADLACAALGSGAINEGELHICIGTSSWVAGHFTKRKIDIPHYTGCIGSANPQKYYLGMAHQETAGVCLEWLKDKVLYHKDQLLKEHHVDKIYEILDKLAAQVKPGAEGLIFTPWMYGERCPLDDDHVRAGLFNIGLNHSREHIVRAVLEGIAFNTRWAMETLENLYSKVDELTFIGGGAKSNIWCQIVADITNRVIHQVEHPHHAGAKGIALLASLALGYIESFEDIKKYIKIKQSFYPNPDNRELYDRLFKEFKNIYKQNKGWYSRMNP